MINYFKSAFEDPLFLRVVMALWSVPFLGVAIYTVLNFSQVEPDYWLLIFPLALSLLGLWLLHTAMWADDKKVDKRIDWLSEGGELIGVIFIIVVLIVAIPIWELLKLRATN